MVQLFRDDAFVGMGELPMVLPGADVRIPFGQDQRIRIVVHDESEESGNVGVVNRDQLNQRRRRFEITSFHSVTMPIEIIDRVPVARDNDIRIDVLKGATPPTTVDLNGHAGVYLVATRGRAAQDRNRPSLLLVKFPRNKTLAQNEGGRTASVPKPVSGSASVSSDAHRGNIVAAICSKKEPVGGGMELTPSEAGSSDGLVRAPHQARVNGLSMLSILVCHSYFLRFDQKQQERAKPYPPLATLQVAAMLRKAGPRGVAVRRHAGR